MGYSDPNFTTRREDFSGNVGGDATTEYAKLRLFQASRLVKVHAVATVAGTTTAHGFDVYHGTSSVGTIVLGTSTAGSIAHSGMLNVDTAALDQISVKSLADGDGQADIIYEYHVLPTAVQS